MQGNKNKLWGDNTISKPLILFANDSKWPNVVQNRGAIGLFFVNPKLTRAPNFFSFIKCYPYLTRSYPRDKTDPIQSFLLTRNCLVNCRNTVWQVQPRLNWYLKHYPRFPVPFLSVRVCVHACISMHTYNSITLFHHGIAIACPPCLPTQQLIQSILWSRRDYPSLLSQPTCLDGLE